MLKFIESWTGRETVLNPSISCTFSLRLGREGAFCVLKSSIMSRRLKNGNQEAQTRLTV